jgi:hypothetical protein
MSIEEKIGGLSDAMNNLATAMNRYAGVMESIANRDPSSIVAPTGDAGDAAPATDTPKKGRGKGKAAEKDAAPADTTKEADPFGDDDGSEAESELTAETIRALVLAVKAKNKDHALGLLKKIGVDTLAKIPEKDYPKVVELAAKVGVTLDDIA